MALLASASLVLVVVAGCSSDDGSDAATQDTTTSTVGEGSSGEPDDGAEAPTTTAFERTEPLPDLTEREQEFADTVLRNMDEDEATIVPGADNECLATHWIHIIGEEALDSSGVSPEDFAAQGPPAVGIDRGTAEVMIDAMGDCGAGVDRFYEQWATAFGAHPGADGEVIDCMKVQVTVEDFRSALVDTFVGEDTGRMGDLQARFETCMSAPG